jgi:hypothetical protein
MKAAFYGYSIILAFLFAGKATGQNLVFDWIPVKQSTADLSLEGWELISSSGLSWPDGRQSVVTFWQPRSRIQVVWRCFSSFDKFEQHTGELCKRPE